LTQPVGPSIIGSPLRVWFNGRTNASQALSTGSIPVTRSQRTRMGPFCVPFRFNVKKPINPFLL
jgi:hypothetical protein